VLQHAQILIKPWRMHKGGMLIGKGAELDHSAMLPWGISFGQTQKAPWISGGLFKR
jgi:hypothetical protein